MENSNYGKIRPIWFWVILVVTSVALMGYFRQEITNLDIPHFIVQYSSPKRNPLQAKPIQHQRAMYTLLDGEHQKYQVDPFDARWVPEEVYYNCNNQTVVLVAWFDDRHIDPIYTFVKHFERLSTCRVKVLGTLNKPDLDLSKELRDARLVIWWHWHQPDDKMAQARLDYPNQCWICLNWDDPHSLFVADSMHSLKQFWDIVFSSGTSALPSYTIAGAKEAFAFVPIVDEAHFYDPDPLYECDVAFVGTQPYSDRGMPHNRTAILQALVDDARKTGLNVAVYGTPKLGASFPEHFKGRIRYEENRKVWSSCKISLNVHAVDGYGGWYANARVTEVLGSRGLLLVDNAVQGILNDGEECVFIKSENPQGLVEQIHEILNNYAKYEPIREQGQRVADVVFSPQALVSKMLWSANRVLKSQPGLL